MCKGRSFTFKALMSQATMDLVMKWFGLRNLFTALKIWFLGNSHISTMPTIQWELHVYYELFRFEVLFKLDKIFVSWSKVSKVSLQLKGNRTEAVHFPRMLFPMKIKKHNLKLS